MSSDYNYDTDAQFFPFFVLTVTSLITLPLTYSLLRAPSSQVASSSKASQITSTYQPDNVDIIDSQRAKQKRKDLHLKSILTAAVGWSIMAYMVYLMVVTARSVPEIWNPYDILDISMSAQEKDINRRYRKLSLTMHPDKREPNAALNETAESVNNQWVEIVKAYKALTDEEVRNNYIMYGNPDGKQSTSFGIALPQFIVAEGSGKYVLLIYGALLGIGLPWLVGSWWYGMRNQTKEKILVTSAGNMFREYSPNMDGGDVVAAISSATEFKDILSGTKADAGLGKLENKLRSSEACNTAMLSKDKKKLVNTEDPERRKTLALLWAYLARVPLDDANLEAEKFELAPTAQRLSEAFTSIALAHGFTAPVFASWRFAQSITQAVSPGKDGAPLLQLPHFTITIVDEIRRNSKQRKHMTVQSFMALPPEQRQALAQAAGLTNDRLRAAESVARQLPLLKVEKAFFKVQGEKYIIPSSLVQLVVKARFIPPGTTQIPPVNEKDLLDIDPADGDIKAQKIEPEENPVPLAYAPYFARDRAPRWHVFLGDNRQGRIAVPPFTFAAFDKKPFDPETGKPTFEVVTLKMQFQAPPQVGEYKFTMHLVCDSYVGFDFKQEVVLNIEDASKGLEVDSDDDISEPDEGEFLILSFP
ncbi:Sec63 Brl domain-containing protein [Neohortaea acidophila]|uniref:Sec63 Brl domain-containing protein n=1 Tax=Neohortaea acidophila TaxID=245834 RepID=A0A6A6PLS4_9PEZI|nr:Sec63 Brl domain-containing protein [Neohortaea acidophila]KAF2480885.1 Sec63 Brl domain-containing protein [Neohortaea acidophila]